MCGFGLNIEYQFLIENKLDLSGELSVSLLSFA